MRRRSVLLASLSLATLAFGFSATRSTAADEPELRARFLIKVQYIALKEASGKKAFLPEAAEVRRAGLVTGEAVDRLRTATAAQIAAGNASVESSMTLAVLEGAGGELRQAPSNGGAGWTGAFLPRVVDGKVSLDLKLRYGVTQSKVFSGQSFDEKLALPENGRLALRFAPTKESPVERIVQIEVTRAAD